MRYDHLTAAKTVAVLATVAAAAIVVAAAVFSSFGG